MATTPKTKKVAVTGTTGAATMQIVIKPPTRKASDVAAWRTALQSADMGRMKALYDLYDDLMIDGVLADAVDKRIGAVTNSPITFQDADGQEVTEIVDLIDSPDFEELLTTIMNARFWGRAAGEFSFADGFFNFAPIPFKHIKLENQNILINETDDKGIDYSVDDQILVIGKPRQFGLFLKTAPYAIYKRGGFGDYAQWLELFGMPQRVGKYSSYDPESRRLLEQAMEQAGSAPWIVIPKEADVETVNNTGTGGSSSAHNDFRKACNEEMLITILGQTMTTLDGSSKSQSETHKAVEEGKNRADMRYVRRILNWLVVPLMEKRGFPVTGGKFVFPESTEELTVADIVSLSELIEIPASYLHDKFSIPVPESGEAIARKAGSQQPPLTPPKEGDKKPPTKEKVKLNDDVETGHVLSDPPVDKGFWKGLFDFFVAAPGRGANRKAGLVSLSNPSIDYTTLRLSDEAIDVTGLVEKALENIYKGLIDPKTNIEPNLFKISWNRINAGIAEAFPAQAYSDPNLAFVFELKNNAGVFSAFAALNNGNEMAAQLVGSDGQLKSYAQFKNDCAGLIDKQSRHLNTEYNTAVYRARMAAKWKEFERDSDLFPNLKWLPSTSVERRAYHELLYGIVLPVSHPFWKEHFPGDLWNCKCGITNTDEAATGIPDINARMKPDPGLDSNPGITAELFSQSHPYFNTNNLLGEAEKLIEKVLLREAETVMNEWKATLPLHNGIDIAGENLKSGAVKITRRSVANVKAHNSDPQVLLSLKDIDKNVASWKYIGWKELEVYPKGHKLAGQTKHTEAKYFMYYETDINGVKRYVNTKKSKYYNNEVFYCITDYKPKGIKKGKLPK